jgi:hypothetical protein
MNSAAVVRDRATLRAANWSRSNFCLDMFQSTRLRSIGKRQIRNAVNDRIGVEPSS